MFIGLFSFLFLTDLSAAERGKRERSKEILPVRTSVVSRSKVIEQNRSGLFRFFSAPFPYRGKIPNTDVPFFNARVKGRQGHTTSFGQTYWEKETFSDNRVLLHIPKGFDIRRPAVMIVFFHGHGATLERDVINRQKVADQISESRCNAVLVAPQLAFDASDSSAGNLWMPGGFSRLIAEAGQKLAKLHGDPKSRQTFARMPVIIVAYSGGYNAAAWSVDKGGLLKRVRGVVLFDALYGELDKFISWLEKDRTNFFISTYLDTTQYLNEKLQKRLSDQGIRYDNSLSDRIASGKIVIFHAGDEVNHRDLVTEAWAKYPIKDLLKRLPEYRR